MEIEDKLLWERAFKKFDDITDDVKELCKVSTRTESKLDTHLAEQEKKGARKEKVFYILIAVVATAGSIITALAQN